MLTNKPNKLTHRKVWSPAELALLQRQDPKAFLLAKSHAKLTRPSQAPSLLLAHEKKLKVKRTSLKPFLMPVLGTVALALGVWLWPTNENAALAPAAASKVTPLSEPAVELSPNQQALYWTYALYDFDRLKEDFRVPAHTIVDHTHASAALQALMPSIDRPTRYIIDRYIPQGRKI